MNTPSMPQRDRASDRPSREEGFTLVEMLVVLAIIALITTLVAPQILRYLGSARVDTAQAQMRNLSSALELYYIDNGGYPTKEEGLSALAAAPGSAMRWNGPYMKGADQLADPWGNPYLYDSTGAAFVIRSLGRDGKEGGEGLDKDLSS